MAANIVVMSVNIALMLVVSDDVGYDAIVFQSRTGRLTICTGDRCKMLCVCI